MDKEEQKSPDVEYSLKIDKAFLQQELKELNQMNSECQKIIASMTEKEMQAIIYMQSYQEDNFDYFQIIGILNRLDQLVYVHNRINSKNYAEYQQFCNLIFATIEKSI